MKYRVKITVVKKYFDKEIAAGYLENPDVGPCKIFNKGDEYIVSRSNYDNFAQENHFCTAAWDIIKHKVYSALQGGDFYWQGWMRDRNQQILCCDDGARPVVFLLEKVVEE